MRTNYMIGALSALALMGGTAFAQSTAGGGVAASGREGSVAGGATAGTADQAEQHHKKMKKRHDRSDRAADRAAERNSASTYGAGSVYTDRDKATGAVTSGGSASGTGAQSTTSSVDAYGSTTKDGSEGEVYGDSTANSGQKPN